MSDFLHDDDRRESDRLRAEDRMRELNDLRAVLSTREGVRVLKRHLARCAVLQPSMSADALSMARSEGVRYVGLSLLADIREASPGAVALMLTPDEPKPTITE